MKKNELMSAMKKPEAAETFAELIKEALLQHLDPDVFEIEIRKTEKTNCIKTGIAVRRKTSPVAAVVYAEDILASLWEKPRPIHVIAEEIAGVVRQPLPFDSNNVECLDEWEYAKDRIQLRLVNTALNKSLLDSCPHREFFDLSVIYWVAVGEKSSARVNNDTLKMWGVTEEELFYAGCESMRRNSSIVLKPVTEVLAERGVPGFKAPFEAGSGAGPSLYVLLGNNPNMASAILFSNAVEELSERYSGDVYIMPSSIHEVLLLPEYDGVDVRFLLQMVRDVNRAVVKKEDFLSDSVYVYRRRTGAYEVIRQEEGAARV